MNERKAWTPRVKVYPVLLACPKCRSLNVKPILHGRANARLAGLFGEGVPAEEQGTSTTIYFCNSCNYSW